MDTQELQNSVTNYKIGILKEQLSANFKVLGKEPPKKSTVEVLTMAEIHKVIIPETMDKLDAAFNLLNQFQEEERFRSYNKTYENFFINDFMVAIQVLIKKYFGQLHVSRVNTSGRPTTPNYIQVSIGFDNDKLVTEQGYIGSIHCPCWENCVMDIGYNNIIVSAKLKFEKEVNEFEKEVQDFIINHSVIKGSAIKVEKVPGSNFLSAIPINPKINPRIVLSEETDRLVNNIIIPSLEDKSKTSMLFTGDFGTGKTETATKIGVTAKELYDRTFFYLHDCNIFTELIPYFKNYDHSVVFCEDIDQISAGDRDSKMNELLNQLDGNELKNVDCTFIFTTNSHKKIHQSMRRPGRIDQIVDFGYCDHTMIAKIFELYAKDVLEQDGEIDYDALSRRCPENLQGAVVAEIARRAVKWANKLHKGVISEDRFKDAIASMRNHIDFMKDEQVKDNTMENLMGNVFFKAMKKAFPLIDTATIVDGNCETKIFPSFTQSKFSEQS